MNRRYSFVTIMIALGMLWNAGGVLALVLDNVYATSAGAYAWSATSSLTTARDRHTATLLPNGRVLAQSGRLSERHPPAL